MKTNTNTRTAPQGRPPASKGEDRREHILDNALNLFAQQGIKGTTIAQIAQASGVTPAMVHYYFRNQEGLLDSLVAERLAPHLHAVWTGLADETGTDPRQIITKFVHRLLAVVDSMPQWPQLWSREIFNAGGCLRERLLAHMPSDNFDKVHHALKEAQQHGRLHPRALPGLVAISAISLVMLPLAARDMLSRIPAFPVPDREDIGRHALALLLDGLCPEEPKDTDP